MKRNTIFILVLVASTVCIFFSCKNESKRHVVSLNGKWEMAKTGGRLPETFVSVTQIPGLVDLAAPSLDTVDTGYQDGWYWHKRTFDLADTSFDIINLKIYKAKYHTKVYINGHFAGENYYCFTPSYYDIKPFLLPAGQPNEILIGVGCKSQLPDTIPDGNDFEKIKYIPGIYDNVEITLSNKPFINNIQCVPDITNEKLRVIAEIETENAQGLKLSYRVSESVSQREIAAKTFSPKLQIENKYVIADFEIDMKDAERWSPESPFLYELTLSTGTDDKSVRFGMRSFRFDPEKQIALLNEEPYYLRGTNVCIFRFFEDPDRGTLPWDSQWPVTLHEKFKDMNWHMARYCIGFPPERWYDICDSIGFMLQDEYPIWWTTNREMAVDARYVAEEYRRWMRERWNHPSVVIWDAQNETLSPQTGLAAKMVRELDLSHRPWENGWSEPIADTDPCEAHPYLFYKYRRTDVEAAEGYKKEFFGKAVRPEGDASFVGEGKFKDTGVYFKNPQLINEYGYIWLNRNGTTTTLTDHIYDVLWDGSNLTPRERLYIYARNLAMLTEYWRVHRKVAGVLHFCGLAYSRPENPRGQTSDHWVNIRNLTFEPEFYKYVKPAFSPVGLMIDAWEKDYPATGKQDIPVYVINDLKTEFKQEVVLTILQNDRIVSTYAKAVTVKGYEVEMVPFEITLPGSPGNYQMKAEITVDGNNVFSLRDIPVK
jgi:hypothetical protein